MRTPQSSTERENPPARSALGDQRLPVHVKIAAAWTSFMFLYLYVDYLHLYQPGEIDAIRAGVIHVFEIGPSFVTIALASVTVPMLMILLSTTLPARLNRIINLVVPALYIPFSMYNASGAPRNYWPFYVLSIGLEVLLLAFILRSAWTWPRRTASASPIADSLDGEPLSMPRPA